MNNNNHNEELLETSSSRGVKLETRLVLIGCARGIVWLLIRHGSCIAAVPIEIPIVISDRYSTPPPSCLRPASVLPSPSSSRICQCSRCRRHPTHRFPFPTRASPSSHTPTVHASLHCQRNAPFNITTPFRARIFKTIARVALSLCLHPCSLFPLSIHLNTSINLSHFLTMHNYLPSPSVPRILVSCSSSTAAT